GLRVVERRFDVQHAALETLLDGLGPRAVLAALAHALPGLLDDSLLSHSKVIGRLKRWQSLGLGLFESAATGTHRLAGIPADGTRVGLGALCTHRKATLVADAARGTDVLEALHILAFLAAQFALNGETLGEGTNLLLLVSREVASLAHRVEAVLL